jgi:predicted nucleotidyltransferase
MQDHERKESINPKYRHFLITTIEKYLPTAKIYLYGSRARKTHSEGSDVDIALDNSTTIAPSTIFKIKDEIEESTMPLFVDLVDVHNVSQKFLESIKKDWVLWKN